MPNVAKTRSARTDGDKSSRHQRRATCRERNLDRGRRISRKGVSGAVPSQPARTERLTVTKVRHVKANTNQAPTPNPMSTDNDWWSWAIIAVIFLISAAAVWGPVIAEAI